MNGILKEYRIVLPMSLKELEIAHLYSVCTVSKAETGGREGVEVVANEPREHEERGLGQFTHKILHISNKVPTVIRTLAPKGSLEVHEICTNTFPTWLTEYANPDYMKDGFHMTADSKAVENDNGELDNVFDLGPEQLNAREIVRIDFVKDKIDTRDARDETDPAKIHLQTVDRGPLDPETWKDNQTPLLCVYKLVSFEFKWWGLQTKVQRMIGVFLRRFYTSFYRTVYSSIDACHGMTLADIRALEEKTKEELDEMRLKGTMKGTSEI